MKKKALSPPSSWPTRAQELYWDYVQGRSLRLKTYRSEQLRLDRFLRYQAQEGFGFTEFPTVLIESYLRQFSPQQRNKLTSLVRCWVKFLYRKKALLLPVHQEICSGKVCHRRRTLLSYEQVMMVLELPQGDDPESLRDRAFLEMAYATGMRRGELVALNLSDIDLAAGVVHVGHTKNRHHRRVPLTRWALHFLERYLREARPKLASPLSLSPALWLKTTGERIYLYQVPKRLERVYKMTEKCGFHATLHQLRHACATHLLRGGAPVLEVKELLGHEDMKSTEIYTRITPTHLQQVHQQHHPRNLPDWPGI